MNFRLAFNLLNLFGKKHIINKWGKEFYAVYRKLANEKLRAIEVELPPSVDAEYDVNYKFIAAYVPIYYALLKLNIDTDDIDMTIWKMNESIFAWIPKRFIQAKKTDRKNIDYLRSYQEKGQTGQLDENDWILTVEEDGAGGYYCRFSECGAYKILARKGYDFVFPCACRIDYLMTNKMGVRFERTKTIADGDGICDNHILGIGFTEWAPEKGFKDRK